MREKVDAPERGSIRNRSAPKPRGQSPSKGRHHRYTNPDKSLEEGPRSFKITPNERVSHWTRLSF